MIHYYDDKWDKEEGKWRWLKNMTALNKIKFYAVLLLSNNKVIKQKNINKKQ